MSKQPIGAHVYIVMWDASRVHTVHRTIDGAFTELERAIKAGTIDKSEGAVEVHPVWDDGEIPHP